jgi:hypothetical protein
MPTLAEARAALHRLAERRAQLTLRCKRGELVSHHAALDLAVTFGKGLRDRLLNSPVRYGAELAAEFQVDPALAFLVLNDVMYSECRGISGASGAAPERRPPRPELPVLRTKTYHLPGSMSPEAVGWRAAHPEQAAADDKARAAIADYDAKWGRGGNKRNK